MPGSSLPSFLSRLIKWFPRLVEAAGVIGGFLLATLPIPHSISAYPAFVIVPAVIFAWIAVRFLPADRTWWLVLATLAGGVVLGAAFYMNSPTWIISCAGKRHFRGTPTAEAAKDMQVKKMTEAQYLFASSCNPELMYTPASLNNSWAAVVALYSATILLTTIGLASALERLVFL